MRYALRLNDLPAIGYLWCALWLVDWRVRHTPPAALMMAEPVSAAACSDPWPVIRRIVTLVETAARYHPANTSCLRRALMIRRLLADRGISTQLVLGARRREDQTIGFHAWLNYNGEPVTDASDVACRFSILTDPDIEHVLPTMR